MKNLIKKYYEKGIYGKEDLKEYVRSQTITPQEYEDITGEIYTAN